MTKYNLIGFYNYNYHFEILPSLDHSKLILNMDCLHPNRMKEVVESMVRDEIEFTSITTHGKILNLFGHFIMDGKVNPEDVLIVIYDENNEMSEYHYDKNGYVVDWPYGFFEMGC